MISSLAKLKVGTGLENPLVGVPGNEPDIDYVIILSLHEII